MTQNDKKGRVGIVYFAAEIECDKLTPNDQIEVSGSLTISCVRYSK